MSGIPQGIRTRLSWAGGGALAGALLTVLLTLRCGSDAPSPALPPADTATAAEWEAREAYWRQRALAAEDIATGQGGMIDRMGRTIRALEARQPERVVVYDTVLGPGDLPPVHLEMAIKVQGGRLATTGFAPAPGGYQPRDTEGADVSDCDDGFELAGGRVTCDRARWGHAYLEAFAGGAAPAATLFADPRHAPFTPVAGAGLAWEPSFRSLWRGELGVTTRAEVELRIRRGLRIW